MSSQIDIQDQLPFGARRPAWLARLIWTVCDWRYFSAATRRLLRKNLARRITGPFDVTISGMNLRLYPAENYCDRTIWARGRLPEPEEHHALGLLVAPDTVFVDIGANVGTYSAYVGVKSGGKARILALEPHPRTFRKLQFNLRANGLETAICRQVAVGPNRETIDLWSDGGSNIGHSSVLKAGTSHAKISVPVDSVPLTDLVAETGFDRIDILKIDIEGYEDRALMPFFRTADIALWPHALLIETVHRHLWADDVVTFLLGNGYKTTFQTPENLILTRLAGATQS